MARRDIRADSRTFAIVGGGAAGYAAAQSLRQAGFVGRVVIISREGDAPYDRPMLSKEYLEGEADAGMLPLREESFYSDYDIELKCSYEVTRVEAATKTITFSNGEKLTCDALLLATGGRPRVLDVPGARLKNIFTLRSFSDSQAIISSLKESSRAVVVGASFIGTEVANALRKRGQEVTVVALESTPFEHILGREIGSLFKTLHERNGVRFFLGAKVGRFEGSNAVEAVVLESAERIAADVVILGVGVDPATELIHGVEKLSDGSIRVDRTLCAATGIYAAGDIASFPDPATGDLIRVEHWTSAQNQGMVAGANMAGKIVELEAVPFFWTNQVGLYFRYVGYARDWDDLIVQGSLHSLEFICLYVKDNKIIAAAGNNKEREMAAIHELMTRKAMPKPDDVTKEGFQWTRLL
jgi:NADPH-dependent 2,4-dienoyl-CoA reductase/sulfur reductase-like enzyme